MNVEGGGNYNVFVFFGLIGAGKSYLAKHWAENHAFAYLNTDVVRKQLAGLEPSIKSAADPDSGIYTPEFSRRTYDELLRQGIEVLRDSPDKTVVLDGSFHSRVERQRISSGFESRCHLLFIHCFCPEMVTKKRLDMRLKDPAAISDGNWEIYLLQKKKFEKPDELSKEKLLELDTSASLEYLIDRLNDFLHTSGS